MPGVVVTTAVRTGPTNTQINPSATLFVAGVTTRGPEGKAVPVYSIAEYETVYGGYTSSGWVHQTLESFFEEGGAKAYVSRVIPDDATSGGKTLLDSAAATSMGLIASGEGAWANTLLKAQVVSTGTPVTSFVVKVLFNDVIVFTSQSHTTVANAVDEINNSATAAVYVTAYAGGSALLPATAAAALFTGGANGGALDETDLDEALEFFIESYGPGAVAAPGFYLAGNYDSLIAHAKLNGRIALLGFDSTDTVSDAVDTAATYSVVSGAEYAAFFYPWVRIPNGSLTSLIPSEGYVAAKRAQVQNSSGAWNVYAGAVSEAVYVTEPQSYLTASQETSLAAAGVNPIKLINGTTRIYGARSVSSDVTNFRFINARETLNYITYEAKRALEAHVFRPIDGRKSLFAEIRSSLVAIMDRIATAGGVYEAVNAQGKQIDPGYAVRVDDSINPISQLAEGTIKAKIGARISSIGETIEIEIVKSNLTASVV